MCMTVFSMCDMRQSQWQSIKQKCESFHHSRLSYVHFVLVVDIVIVIVIFYLFDNSWWRVVFDVELWLSRSRTLALSFSACKYVTLFNLWHIHRIISFASSRRARIQFAHFYFAHDTLITIITIMRCFAAAAAGDYNLFILTIPISWITVFRRILFPGGPRFLPSSLSSSSSSRKERTKNEQE